VEDQGQLGSCTANALAGALEFLERKDKVSFEDFSRLFIYYDERAVEHTIKSDSGAMIRDGIKTLAKQGVCSEKKWPYIISKF
jgi:C1A family cysteine protease